MTPMPEIVFGREPVVSSNTEGRRSSPFRSRGARSESTERVRSANTATSLGYRQICEEVISPLMAGLTTRMGALEVRMDTHESGSKQEIDGLKGRITQLEARNSQLESANRQLHATNDRRFEKLERDLKLVSEVAANHNHFVSGFNKHPTGIDCSPSRHSQVEACKNIK